jgi:predicted transcriptional regulator
MEQSDSSDDEKKIETAHDLGTDLSDEENFKHMNGDKSDITMTAFDEYDNKSMDIKAVGMSERAADPEIQAKEEYMRKLMSFRKDELVLPEESDDDDANEEETQAKRDKTIAGVEDAYDLVERVEDKMNKIAMVIKGMDKRMSYNLRLIGSVLQPEIDQHDGSRSPMEREVKHVLSSIPFE